LKDAQISKMNNKDYVITGYGVCVANGSNPAAYWKMLSQNKQAFTKKNLFGPNFPAQTVAMINDDDIEHGLTRRQTKRLDRFTILAMAATRQAFNRSQFPTDNKELLDRFGIFLGNNTGGWGFVEPQMAPLYAESMNTLSPYVATAWFPTAVQGEVSILFGLGGYSKTYSAENISAGFAFEHALELLQDGVVTSCLVGGAEAPITQLVYNACMGAGLLSESGEYQPYTEQAQGSVLGEGVALFVIESQDQAKQRGAKIRATIEGIGKGATFEESIGNCLANADKIAQHIDYIILSARATVTDDQQEYAAIARIFKDHPHTLMSAPKSKYGNLIGASMAIDVVTACLALEKQTVPPTYSAATASVIQPKIGEHVIISPKAAKINNIIVNGQDNYGQCMSLLVSH
jgi:3-oxoacyl-(acyl-carrier-protein) synthase